MKLFCFTVFFTVLLGIDVSAQFDNYFPVSTSAAQNPFNINYYDIDSDGDLDVISTFSNSNKIEWYANDGTGNFSARQLLFANTNLKVAMSADMNGDGSNDIIAIGVQKMYLFTNIGNNEFASPIEISNFDGFGQFMAIFDFDNDNDMDIIVFANQPYLVKNNGNSQFNTSLLSSLVNIFDPTIIGDLKTIDINNDGYQDLFFSRQSGEIWYCQNNNGISFNIPSQSVQTNMGINGFDFGDINSDGKFDIIFSNPDYHLCYLLGSGNGNFHSQQIIPTSHNGIWSIHVSDIDNDGTLDVVGADQSYIYWYKNNGDLSFSESEIPDNYSITPNNLYKLCLEDFNGDNLLDIIVANYQESYIRCYIMDSGTSFSSYNLVSNQTSSTKDILNVDLDQDGYEDLIMTSSGNISWYRNTGSGNFEAPKVILKKNSSYSSFKGLSIDDFDNDGDLDIASISNTEVKSLFFINDGNQNFSFHEGNGIPANKILCRDVNFDGNIDFFQLESTSVKYFKNNGNFNFPTFGTTINGTYYPSLDMEFDDENSTSSTTLLIASYDRIRKVVYNNLGNIVSNFSTLALNIKTVKFVDLDLDGDKDAVVALNDGQIGWIKNEGSSFSSFIPLGNSTDSIWRIYAFDIDNDGDIDIIYSYNQETFHSHTLWMENNNMQFDNLHTVFIPLSPETGDYFAHIDIDNDGDFELITSSGSQVYLLKNKSVNPYQANGNIFIDYNQNGIKDGEDTNLNLIKIKSNPNDNFGISNSNGVYKINFSASNLNQYEIYPELNQNWAFTTPSSYFIDVNATMGEVQNNFGVFPINEVDSININLTGGFPRCNQNTNYYISVINKGTTKPSGVIEIKLDSSIIYINSHPPVDSILNDKYYWHFDSISCSHTQQFLLEVNMPDFNFIGDTLISTANVFINSSIENVLYHNSDTLNQILVCAYDPNDKSGYPYGEGSLGLIPDTTKYIDYLIRFQNTGNDTAISITISDFINNNIKFEDLEILAYSHPLSIDINPNRELKFIFNNIMLPDSNTNEPLSHGFIEFRAPLYENLLPGSKIQNKANIYFDYNPPIQTNTSIHTIKQKVIDENLSIIGAIDAAEIIEIYPNPTENKIFIKTNGVDLISFDIKLYSIDGKQMKLVGEFDGNKKIIDLEGMNTGIYMLVLQNDNINYTYRVIKR